MPPQPHAAKELGDGDEDDGFADPDEDAEWDEEDVEEPGEGQEPGQKAEATEREQDPHKVEDQSKAIQRDVVIYARTVEDEELDRELGGDLAHTAPHLDALDERDQVDPQEDELGEDDGLEGDGREADDVDHVQAMVPFDGTGG